MWWLGSPNNFNSGNANEFNVNNANSANNGNNNVNNSNGLRAVFLLVTGTTITGGDGTPTNPYIVG